MAKVIKNLVTKSERYNIPRAMKEKYGIAHNAYWEYEGMYADICKYFLT